ARRFRPRRDLRHPRPSTAAPGYDRPVTPPELIIAFPPPPSLARPRPPERAPLRLGLVQERWHADPAEHEAALAAGIAMAASEGATIVCLQELTLLPYFAVP